MATSSGNSSGSTQLLSNSGSEGELQVLKDQRKRKRMESNRESARRSRMRKQKYLNDLMSQVTQLRKDNHQILTSISITTQNFLNVEAENSILRAQVMELSQRLDSLNDILGYINTTTPTTTAKGVFDDVNQGISGPDSFMIHPPNNMMMYLNQPIMASPDLFQY